MCIRSFVAGRESHGRNHGRHPGGGQPRSRFHVFTPMMGADGKARPELFVKDNLHLNEAGYELWEKIIGKKL